MHNLRIASDLMRRDLYTLTPSSSLMESVAGMLKHAITGMPVVDADGRYAGVFSERCCIRALTPIDAEAVGSGSHAPSVSEFMSTKLLVFSPDEDVFVAIDHLMKRRFSGAPVVDASGSFVGNFSERTAMRVLIAAAYDQQPATTVGGYMNPDRQRIIGEDASLLDVNSKFLNEPYRRLPVLRAEHLVGQVSRRDSIRTSYQLALRHANRTTLEAPIESCVDREAKTIGPEADILSIARVFLDTNFRRLPVVSEGKLVGQVSRRDVLSGTSEWLTPEADPTKSSTLYLSLLTDEPPPSIG